MMPASWIISPVDGRRDILARELNVSPLIAQMILNRGIHNIQVAKDYLEPKLTALLPPSQMPATVQAAARIAEAIRKGQKIVIFGDYDTDGITAAATLYHALKHFFADVHTYIPHRVEEGYGLNEKAVQKFCEEGAGLIVTVDCGITGHGPAAVACKHNVDLIITDHHEGKDTLPQCHTIVHPRLPVIATPYGNPHLCGAGVAFKVAWAVGQAMSGSEKVSSEFKAFLVELLAFTALGTIADVVPLIGENRAIAHFGLKQLPRSNFTGIQALIKSARFDGQTIDGYKVGFSLAPRLNAAGRMGHAEEALRMLTTATAEEAEKIGEELERKNKERQETEKAVAEEAMVQADMFGAGRCLVVAGKGWHPGVVGIVASRLVERYHKPAIVLVDSGDELHGSARSIEGFNLAEALQACGEWLLRFGGHAMAAGLKMEAVKLEPFILAMQWYCEDRITDDMMLPKVEIDAVASLGEITSPLAFDMARLGPFGSHNRRPLLVIKDAIIREVKVIGKTGKHLAIQLAQGADRMKALAFGQGEHAHKLPIGERANFVVEPTINVFNGRSSVELLVRDMSVSP